MRFIDDLRNHCLYDTPSWIQDDAKSIEDWKTLSSQAHAAIANPNLPIIEITNVAEYYYYGMDQEAIGNLDFPNCAPPFQECWFEYKLPPKIRTAYKGSIEVNTFRPRIGMYVRYDRLDEGGWEVYLNPYIEVPDVRPVTALGPCNEWRANVTKDGALGAQFTVSHPGAEVSDSAMTALKELISLTHSVFLAISFMHCKNVILTTECVDKKLAKRYQERHGMQPVKFHTLVIEPLKQILRKEGKSEQTGLHKALHICRGHFRDYREGKGLFGKHNVLVWQDSIVRGTIEKDIPRREIEFKL